MSDSQQLTILGHLREFRVRLIWMALTVAITSTTAFFFADQLFEILKAPANPDPIAYVGISDNTIWNFTTDASGFATPALSPESPAGGTSLLALTRNNLKLESTVPADGTTGVAVNQPLVLNFNLNVAPGTGDILIQRTTDNVTVQAIPVNSPNVTIVDNSVTIVHADLVRATDYHIALAEGVFTDDPEEIKLVFIEVTEGFGTTMRVCIVTGVIASMPVIVYHLLMFVMPALTRRERRTVILILPWVTLMFAAGVYFGYTYLIPPALKFLLTFSAGVADAQIRMGNYVDFVARLLLVIGVMFELPVITSFLARMGIIDHKWLANKRRWFFLIAFALAAVITPTPDPFNQSIVAGTLVVLYEVSIWLALLFQKRRPKSEFEQFMNDEGEYAPDDDAGSADETAEEKPAPPTQHYDEQDG